jgi:hypothetical protein
MQSSTQKSEERCNPNNPHCMKEKWVRGIPTFEKKRSWPQSNDIREHTLQAVQRDDSFGFPSKRNVPFLSEDGHP